MTFLFLDRFYYVSVWFMCVCVYVYLNEVLVFDVLHEIFHSVCTKNMNTYMYAHIETNIQTYNRINKHTCKYA
jgi:hypothetical protein